MKTQKHRTPFLSECTPRILISRHQRDLGEVVQGHAVKATDANLPLDHLEVGVRMVEWEFLPAEREWSSEATNQLGKKGAVVNRPNPRIAAVAEKIAKRHPGLPLQNNAARDGVDISEAMVAAGRRRDERYSEEVWVARDPQLDLAEDLCGTRGWPHATDLESTIHTITDDLGIAAVIQAVRNECATRKAATRLSHEREGWTHLMRAMATAQQKAIDSGISHPQGT